MVERSPVLPQTLWERALAEDSNLALDWLWLYTQVERDEQRQFCLDKVRFITGDDRWFQQIIHTVLAEAPERGRMWLSWLSS